MWVTGDLLFFPLQSFGSLKLISFLCIFFYLYCCCFLFTGGTFVCQVKNLPFKMLWRKIKANIHMPCSVQSPQSYAFSSSSDRCLPGFLFSAPGVRLNICVCLDASQSESLYLIYAQMSKKCPLYFNSPSLTCVFAFIFLRSDKMRLCDCLGESAARRLSSCAPRLAASPCYSKGMLKW